jgi:hypothetical protein
VNTDIAPEVVIKVLGPGSNNLKSIRQHLEMMQHGAGRAMETDLDSRPISTRGAARDLIKQWGLDSDERVYRYLKPVRKIPRKIVHKMIFSMPAGTSPEKLLCSVRSFAKETFGREHRYALALHTDEPHPHVHLVLRAMKEGQLKRLNIRNLQLREWRRAFARHLCANGVAAKATFWSERQGQVRPLRTRLVKRPTTWPSHVDRPEGGPRQRARP